jgi:3-hydroxybutyryl-CoA dehydratase
MAAFAETISARVFAVGDGYIHTQIVDDTLVRAYADVTGDHNKIHVDEAFTETTIFGRRIAHGGILFGMISKVLGDDMPGVGTICLSQLINFHAPVCINDRVSPETRISALLPKHVAKVNCIMKKQTGEVVIDGVATVKLPGWLIKH